MNLIGTWPDAPANEVMKQQALEHVTPTSSEYYGAAAQEASWANPLDSAGRMLQLSIAKNSGKDVLQPDQLNKEFGIKGELTFDYALPRQAAEIMRDRKQDEIRVRDTLSRGGGSAVGAFAIEAAVAMMDPINVASMFIPVVGEQRAAMLTARLGKLGSRLAVGSVEGSVGIAMTEPIVYMAADQEQRNYTVYDALFKVGLGGLLGAGLHAGVGFAGDFIDGAIMKRIAPETHDAALRGGAADLLSGNSVRSGDVLSMDRNVLEARAREELLQEPRFADIKRGYTEEFPKERFQMSREEYLTSKMRDADKPLPFEITGKTPNFESNLDLAVFAATQKQQPKLAKQALEYLKETTGLSEKEIADRGKTIRKLSDGENVPRSEWKELNEKFQAPRRGENEKAFLQGRFVPKEVLDEHPELVRDFPEQAKSSVKNYESDVAHFNSEAMRLKRQEFRDAVATRRDELIQEEMVKFQSQRQSSVPTRLDGDGVEKIIDPEKVDDFGSTKEIKVEEEIAKIDSEMKELESEARKLREFTEEEEMVLEKLDKELGLVKKRESGFRQAASCVLQFLGYV